MKILWVINYVMPKLSKQLGLKINNTGGWLINLSEILSKNHELVICYPDSVNRITECNNIKFYGFKRLKKCKINDIIDCFAHLFDESTWNNTKLSRIERLQKRKRDLKEACLSSGGIS